MGKKEKTTKKGAGDGEDLKREQKLQAVVLADSFMKTFRPISWEKPKVLMPLVNTPMLDYTIDFLAQNNVREVFVFCVWHAEMLQEYVESKPWPPSVTVQCISSSTCLSAGDALREIDAMGIVRSDPFVLINGDVVSNMKLGDAIAFHKEKKKVDNNAVMTVALKAVQKNAAVVPILDDLVVAMDRTSNQILLFDNDVTSQDVAIPLEVMVDHPGIDLRTDLLDCHVDICSPEFLLQFSDNFDYQNIRKHFIKNEVVNWDLGMHVYGYVLNKEYAARVQDPRTYHAVSRDIIRRWVYPVVPDLPKLQEACSSSVHIGRYIYREDNVRIARSARIGNGVVLGSGTVVEENAYVAHSVLGPDCVIGAGAVVEESHLWKGVRLMENVKVHSSILCDNVVVKSNASVQRGCVLSFGVVVGSGVQLPAYTRLSRISKKSKAAKGLSENEMDDDDTLMAASPMISSHFEGLSVFEGHPAAGGPHGLAGPDGFGFTWKSSGGEEYMDVVESASDDEDGILRVCNEATGESELISGLKATSMGCAEEESWKTSLWRAMPQPPEDSESDDDSHQYDEMDGDDAFGYSGDQEQIPGGSGSNADFESSVKDMVSAGYASKHDTSNILLEIMGLKFAENKEFNNCLRGAVPAILDIAVSNSADASPAKVLTALKELLTSETGWGNTILSALIQNEEDEVFLIEAIEGAVLDTHSTLHSVFRMVLQICYDEDLVSDDALKIWITARQGSIAPHYASVAIQKTWAARVALFNEPVVQTFVEWILDDEDEDDDDEDEEDSEEDDA